MTGVQTCALPICGFPERELDEYNLPSWSVFQDLIKDDDRHFFTEGLGGLPLVNVRTDFIADQKGIAHWRGVLLPFKKPKVEEGEESAAAQPTLENDSPENDPDEESEACDACGGWHRPSTPCDDVEEDDDFDEEDEDE